jgi:hypothetical protein
MVGGEQAHPRGGEVEVGLLGGVVRLGKRLLEQPTCVRGGPQGLRPLGGLTQQRSGSVGDHGDVQVV